MYRPAIVAARLLHETSFGRYSARLLGDVESAGCTQYSFVLEVIDVGTGEPCFYVAAELSLMAAMRGRIENFLCTYHGTTHSNYGISSDCLEPETFLVRAVALAKQHFGLNEFDDETKRNGTF